MTSIMEAQRATLLRNSHLDDALDRATDKFLNGVAEGMKRPAPAERPPAAQAICAACMAADVHLECSYPACSCTQIPRAAQTAYEHGAEQAKEVAIDFLARKGYAAAGLVSGLKYAIAAACLRPAEEEIEVSEEMEKVGREALLAYGNGVREMFQAMERQRRKDET